MTIKRSIGINDLSSDNLIEVCVIEEGTYGKSLEEVITACVRSAGGLANLLEPIEDAGPFWEGYSRVVITVGPPEEYHPCTHCGDDIETDALCQECMCCWTCCSKGLTVGGCEEEE